MLEKKKIAYKAERAVLVGLALKDQTDEQLQEYLDELAFLAETAGADCSKKVSHKDFLILTAEHLLAKENLKRSKIMCREEIFAIVIFDDELNGSQITNIEKALDVKTIDRI